MDINACNVCRRMRLRHEGTYNACPMLMYWDGCTVLGAGDRLTSSQPARQARTCEIRQNRRPRCGGCVTRRRPHICAVFAFLLSVGCPVCTAARSRRRCSKETKRRDWGRMRGDRGRRWTRGVEAVPSLKRVSASATTRFNFPFLRPPSSSTPSTPSRLITPPPLSPDPPLLPVLRVSDLG